MGGSGEPVLLIRTGLVADEFLPLAAVVVMIAGPQTRSSRPRLAGDVAGEPRSSWRRPLVIPDQRAALEVVHERLLGCHVAWPVTGVAGRGGMLDPLVAACLVGVGAQEVADRQMPPLMMRAWATWMWKARGRVGGLPKKG